VGGVAMSWPRSSGADSIHFITDGAMASDLGPRTSSSGPDSPAPPVTIHSVFEPAGNVAITAFDVRPSLAGDHAGDAYLEVANYAPAAQTVHLAIQRGRTTIYDRRVDIRGGETLRQILPVPRGGDAALRALVDAPTDALAIDNEAVAWIEHARPLVVTVVGQHTSWLAGLLGRDPDVRATFVDPSSEVRPTDQDVVIFDRWAPADAPRRPSLSFAPPLETVGEELRPAWTVAGSHPVISGIDPFTLSIDKARAYRLPNLSVVARSARGTPLVYAGESENRRAVVVTFGATESNLAAAPAFPVLIGNALEWLGRVSSAGSHRPGPMTFDASIVRVTDPRGADVPLTHFNHAAVGLLRAPGMYVADGGAARTAIAVNAGSPQVSNLLQSTLRPADRARPVAAGASQRPWWMYSAAVAFGLALAEWWTWQRRITV
jgi:hypothetical protein